jgi:hypothetical protein
VGEGQHPTHQQPQVLAVQAVVVLIMEVLATTVLALELLDKVTLVAHK